MRKILEQFLIVMFLGILTIIVGLVQGQDAPPTPTRIPLDEIEGLIRPTPSFPSSSLFCDEATRINDGMTWNGITVGKSRLEELQTIVEQIDDYVVEKNSNSFVASLNTDESFRLEPTTIVACVHAGIITVLELRYTRSRNRWITWDSYLLSHGEPDAVTWYDGINVVRLLFWFEEGIALNVSNLDDSRGVISSVVYFTPIIEGTNYEEEYPYNRTWSPDTPELRDLYGEQNPFDFDAIIATVTAQPSRTPTPTQSFSSPSSRTPTPQPATSTAQP